MYRNQSVDLNVPMNTDMKACEMLRRPSAFLPIAMSLIALAVVLVHIAMFGVAREADEGAAAHIWQLLMAGQLPIVAFFVVKSVRQSARFMMLALALQLGAALLALAPVYFLHL